MFFVYEKRQCETDPSELNDVVDAQGESEPRGLPNTGNTCWFNSMMQALSSSKIFRDTLLAIEPSDVSSSLHRNFISALQKLVRYLYPTRNADAERTVDDYEEVRRSTSIFIIILTSTTSLKYRH